MAANDPTPDLVRGLWKYMSQRYGTRVLDKRTSPLMKLFGWGLDLFGVVTRDKFASDFVTTFGKRIYAPFVIGDPTPPWDLWQQVVICAHEHQHVIQATLQPIRFEVKYLFSSRARALYEADAYSCEVALELWRTGTIPFVAGIAKCLKSYGCSSDDVQAAQAALSMAAANASTGLVNEASRITIDWLDDHARFLKHSA